MLHISNNKSPTHVIVSALQSSAMSLKNMKHCTLQKLQQGKFFASICQHLRNKHLLEYALMSSNFYVKFHNFFMICKICKSHGDNSAPPTLCAQTKATPFSKIGILVQQPAKIKCKETVQNTTCLWIFIQKNSQFTAHKNKCH
jgi:hypothetical protein